VEWGLLVRAHEEEAREVLPRTADEHKGRRLASLFRSVATTTGDDRRRDAPTVRKERKKKKEDEGSERTKEGRRRRTFLTW